MKTTIIVGHHSFIAQRLLLSRKLLGTVKSTSRQKNNKNTIYLDLSSPEHFNYKIINDHCTIVFLAAISAPDECKNNYAHSYSINVNNSSYFIEQCIKRGACVIFASSDVVYGESSKIIDEDSYINPLGHYAEMKAELEGKFSDSNLFKAIRFSYIFANNDKFTSYVLDCITNHHICEVFEPFSRSVVYIEDVVDGIVSLCKNWNIIDSNVINFSGPKLLSRIEFATAIQGIFSQLDIKVTFPGEQFYQSRPKIINMKSKYFETLLGRSPYSINEAILQEFKK